MRKINLCPWHWKQRTRKGFYGIDLSFIIFAYFRHAILNIPFFVLYDLFYLAYDDFVRNSSSKYSSDSSSKHVMRPRASGDN
ncbi:hypothetical protein HanPSC8_Chr05g0204761 [Helianthus annuus]|nr:hypothetical protein HanPSC8_Chr05g0204761 [Helianthus annuus]